MPKSTARNLVRFELELSQNRLLWLAAMARERRCSEVALIEGLIINATLDYQQARYPESDPEDTPTEAWLKAHPEQGIVE